MIKNVFELDDTTVASVLTPLTQVRSIPMKATIREALTSIKAQLSGWFSYPYAGTVRHPKYKRVDRLSALAVTYSSFGQVAAITAPPAAQTVSLSVCGQAYRVVQSGHQVCSIFG